MRVLGILSVLAVSLLALAPKISASDIGRLNAPPSAAEVPIVLLIDATSGQVLYERNADRRFMPASITKVMTAFTAFELIEEGKLNPRQTFAVRPETFREWRRKGSTMFLDHDSRPTVDQLITGTMNVSANDGAIVLAEGASGSLDEWNTLMNAKALEIGLQNSYFGTPNGWMDEGKTFVTARDLARLASVMIRRHPKKYARYVGRSEFTFNGITQPNRDPMLGRIEGADGIKTGFTNEAGVGFLGSVKRGSDRLIVVVAGADRNSDRDRAARDLIDWGFTQFDHEMLFGAGVTIGIAKVQGGDTINLPLRARGPIHVSAPKGTSPDIKMRIRYDGPLKAPIEEGQQVAVLVLEVEGMPDSHIPLVAAEDVGRAGFLSRIWNGLAGWVT